MRRVIQILALAAPACGFGVPGASPAQDGAPVVDVAPGDVARDGADPSCTWPYDAEYVDPCSPSRPASVPSHELLATGRYTYDTDTGSLSPPFSLPNDTTSTLEAGVRIWWVDDLHLGPDAHLRVIGPHPLAIVSLNDLRIEGELDASSRWAILGPVPEAELGAGANPPACPMSPPGPGETCDKHGGSGGGGGAFSGNGGMGGEGGGTHSCDGGQGKPGGAGGVALAAIPPMLRGGCAGRDGARSENVGSLGGLAGPGGGAVALVARNAVVVDGVVHAGGAGGLPGARRAGGGGGGSGGMIVIEATSISVARDAVIAANGGGGGGGCDNGFAFAGDGGRPDDQQAPGGTKEGNGSDGGNGAGGSDRDGATAASAERGGGGGGGSSGFVRLHAAGLGVDGTVSPPAS